MDIFRIVFGIVVVVDVWKGRKEYIKLWWKFEMRGFVWLDKILDGEEWDDRYFLFKVFEKIINFEYINKKGWRFVI